MSSVARITLLGAVAALMLPAGAAASRQGDYEGKVKGAPGSEITFKVDRRKNQKHVKVFRFTATDVPTDCAGSSDTTELSLPSYFGLRIRDGGTFHIKDSPSGFRDESLYVVDGEIGRSGKASGTLKIVDDFDVVGVCRTGVVRWTASR
jgi:hypothetical protein